jgi:capsular exopolysaccharide synthesis family protein
VASYLLAKVFLGIIIALGLGTGLAFVVDLLDKRFKTTDDAERHLGIPFLGLIPRYRTKKTRLITLHDRWSSAAEAYRSLRTWIQRASSSEPHASQTVLITSALAGEGKSTTGANLAMSFGHLGWKTLLVDADMRRPTLHRMFNVSPATGLVDVLAYGVEWQQVLQPTAMDNVKVLPVGRRPENPSELLSTHQMRHLLADLRQAFDIIIVDASVTLSIPDVVVLAPHMDSVLLVHYPTKGNKDATLEAKKTLDRAGARLLGVVFNRVSPKEQRSYYYGKSYYRPPYGPMRSPQDGRREQTSVALLPIQHRDRPEADTPTGPDVNNTGTS